MIPVLMLLATGAFAGPADAPTAVPAGAREKWALMAWNMAELHWIAGQSPSDSPGEQKAWAELQRKIAADPAYAWLKEPGPEMRQNALSALQGRRTDPGAWTQAEIDGVLARQKSAIDSLYTGWRSAQSAPRPDAPTGTSGTPAAAPGQASDRTPPPPTEGLDAIGASLPPALGGSGGPGGGTGGAGPNSGAGADSGGGPKSPSAPNMSKNRSLAALKDPGSLGGSRTDDLQDPNARGRAPEGRGGSGPKPDGAGAPGGAAGGAGVPAASGAAGTRSGTGPAGAAGPGAVAAGPGFGPAPSTEASGARGTGGPRPGGGSGAVAVAAGGAGSSAAGGGPGMTGSLPAGGRKETEAKVSPEQKVTEAKPEGKRPDELSEAEKKELSEIQDLLKEAADSGSLDAGALAGAADQLPEGSLALQETKERIRDIVAMAGGELSMAQRQEVIELAAKLGLDEVQARALVRSLERAEPSAPKSGSPRALGWWLRLQRALLSWWRRLLAWLGLSHVR